MSEQKVERCGYCNGYLEELPEAAISVAYKVCHKKYPPQGVVGPVKRKWRLQYSTEAVVEKFRKCRGCGGLEKYTGTYVDDSRATDSGFGCISTKIWKYVDRFERKRQVEKLLAIERHAGGLIFIIKPDGTQEIFQSPDKFPSENIYDDCKEWVLEEVLS